MVEVPPSPKSQDQVLAPTEPSVNVDVVFWQPLAKVNDAAAGGVTLAGRLIVVWHPLFDVTVRITLKLPEVEKM